MQARALPGWVIAMSAVAVTLSLGLVLFPEFRGKAAGAALMTVLIPLWVELMIDDKRRGLLGMTARAGTTQAPAVASLPAAVHWLAMVGGGLALILTV